MGRSTPRADRLGTLSRARDLAALGVRLGVGGTLIAHGSQKLFGAFGGHGIKGTGAAFDSMGFKPGQASALAAGLGEAGGGASLALGLGTGLGGAAAAGTMMTAASTHVPNGFFNTAGGLEFPAILGLVSAGIGIAGPGRYSFDELTSDVLNRPWLRVAALVASLAGAAVVMFRRETPLPAAADGADG